MKILLMLLLLSPSLAQGASWPNFRRNETRAGYTRESVYLPLGAPWVFDAVEPVLSSPVVAYDRVYIGSRAGKVHCLDAYTGALLWTHFGGGWFDATPAIDNGIVYAPSRDGKLYALNALTGAPAWPSAFDTASTNLSSPIVLDAEVYFVAGFPNKKLYVLDAQTGTVSRSTTVANASASSLVIDKANGRIFLGMGNGRYNAWDLDLHPIWAQPIETEGSIYFATPALSSSTLLAAPGDDDRTLHAYAAASGAETWASEALVTTADEISLTGGVAVTTDTAYLGSATTPHKLYAIDLSTGGKKWELALGNSSKFGVASSPALANNILFILTPQGQLKMVHAGAGDVRDTQALDGEGLSSPAVANGWVYAATMNGKVYGFPSQRTWSLSSPDPGLDTAGVLEGTVTVKGTVQSASLQSYTLEYGRGDDPATWTTLVTGASPVERSTLAVWNTNELPVTDSDNRYTLRLRVAESGSSDLVNEARYTFSIPQTRTAAVGGSSSATVRLADGTEIYFPEGALTGSDTLTVKKLFSPFKNENVGIPRGVQGVGNAREFALANNARPTFHRMVTLKMPYTAGTFSDEDSLRVYYFDESIKEWRIVNTSKVMKGEGRVRADVDHFTMFRVMQFAPAATLLQDTEVYTYPNPARGDTVNFKFLVGDTSDVTIRVYDVAGGLVAKLEHNGAPGGIASTLAWDVSGKASGVYIYKLEAKSVSGDTASVMKKLAIIH